MITLNEALYQLQKLDTLLNAMGIYVFIPEVNAESRVHLFRRPIIPLLPAKNKKNQQGPTGIDFFLIYLYRFS